MKRAIATLLGLGLLAASTAARADDAKVRVAPGLAGGVGAWLVVGPFPASAPHPAPGAPRLGAAVDAAHRWVLASSNDGLVDLIAPLSARGQRDVVAYAGGVLHVEKAGRRYLLLGTDDGVKVSVDGRELLARDDARPAREDDDVVPLDLSAGDHSVLFELHQRDGAWGFRARFVDETFAPEATTYLELPGATADDARSLATKMSWVSLDRGLVTDGYAPRLRVEMRGGAPLDVPLAVRARLMRTGDAAPFVDVSAGDVPRSGSIDVALPRLRGDLLEKIEDRAVSYVVDVGTRSLALPFAPRRDVRLAVSRANRALEQVTRAVPQGDQVRDAARDSNAWLQRGSRESVERLRDRLVRFVAHGDQDMEAERDEARELDAVATSLERGKDPFASRTGPMRRAYRSALDNGLSEYGVYVPPSYTPGSTRRYPLIVALHGLNGQPMEMIRWLFGGDDPKKDGYWEDRHLALAPPPAPPLPTFDAFVVTPSGRGSTMYREQGEEDVLAALDEVVALYPIDPKRITITGPSMGGIGSALVPLRHPDRFAAAEPLCGYHNYFVRRDVSGRPIRPWERFLVEERSNAFWAENGARLPLFIVHGTLDLPEANSGSLIERYVALKYDVTHEHPHLGHNVWQTTYENMKGASWLLGHSADLHPARIRFRTAEARDGDDAWVHVDALGAPGTWGEIEARVTSKSAIEATTKGIDELHFDRDDKLVDASQPIGVTIDGTHVSFASDAPMVLHRDAGAWRAGPREARGLTTPLLKHGAIAGPFRDVYRTPLLFVYGASDPKDTVVNERVARAWAAEHPGLDLAYDVISDSEFLARGEAFDNARSLFLVGSARTNRVLRAIEAELPIKIDGDAVLAGAQRFTGRETGVAFVHPNPKRPDRYVAVVEGVDATGTLRSLSLPDLLPDFVIYDVAIAPSRGQLLLGAGAVIGAGFFENDWSLPTKIEDPLAKSARPAPQNEHDATPYLP